MSEHVESGPAVEPLSHTRVPRAATALCRSRAEQACVFYLWDQADEHRWEPFAMSMRDLCGGLISAGAGVRLLADLVEAGLVDVIERGRGTKPSILAVRNPTSGLLLRSRDPSRERYANAERTLSERKANAKNVDQHDENGGAENATRTLRERKANAGRAFNARAEDHPPTSNLQPPEDNTGSSTQVDSPPAGAAGSDRGAGAQAEGSNPQSSNPQSSNPQSSKPTPTEQARALWDTWEPVRVKVYGGKPGRLSPGRVRTLAARVGEYGSEDVAVVLAWWLTSDHPRAVYLRTQGYTWDTVIRSGNFGSYLDLANSRPPQAATKPGGSTHSDSGSAEDVWQRLLRAIASGPAGLDGAPPDVLSALDVAGGYRELSQITHPADRARFRSRFIDAFERGAAA